MFGGETLKSIYIWNFKFMQLDQVTKKSVYKGPECIQN